MNLFQPLESDYDLSGWTLQYNDLNNPDGRNETDDGVDYLEWHCRINAGLKKEVPGNCGGNHSIPDYDKNLTPRMVQKVKKDLLKDKAQFLAFVYGSLEFRDLAVERIYSTQILLPKEHLSGDGRMWGAEVFPIHEENRIIVVNSSFKVAAGFTWSG